MIESRSSEPRSTTGEITDEVRNGIDIDVVAKENGKLMFQTSGCVYKMLLWKGRLFMFGESL